MRIFITGATGYVGGRVAAELASVGHDLVCLARSERAAELLAAQGYSVRRGGLGDGGLLRQAASQADGVVHCATARDGDIRALDQASTRSLLAGLGRSGKPFIYTSDTWLYGDTGEVEATEGDLPSSAVGGGPHGPSWRYDLEREVLDAADVVRAIVIRLAPLIYGRGGNNLLPRLIADGRKTGVLYRVGNGSNHLSAVHVDDLARLYALALASAPAGTLLNAVSSTPTLREVFDAMARAAGGASVEELSIEEGISRLGPAAAALAMEHRVSGSRARELLGWSPRESGPAQDIGSGSYVSR